MCMYIWCGYTIPTILVPIEGTKVELLVQATGTNYISS